MVGTKMRPPLSAKLVLENEPYPGGIAELTLNIESKLPEAYPVDVRLRLPENLHLAWGSPSRRRTVGPRSPASIPFRVRIPDGRRYLIEAVVSLATPEGGSLTASGSAVIDLGEPEEPAKQPITVETSDGRTLGITVAE